MLKIAHYLWVLQTSGRGYSERCHCQKMLPEKLFTKTFGVKELVFSCEKKQKTNLRCCKLVFWLLTFSYFSVKWINKFRDRFLDKCFRSAIISLVCRSVLNHCSFPRAAFSLKSVTTNSLLLHIFFTFHGVQYTVKIGSLIR